MKNHSTSASSNKVFELGWDLEHLGIDFDYDMWLEEGSRWELMALYRTHPIVLPEDAEFEGWEFILQDSDYPYNREHFPIMSKRMLETLLSVRGFSHQAIPIEITDVEGTYDPNVNDFPRSGIVNKNFMLIQLLEHQDIFDWENSIYEPFEDLPGRVDQAKHIVLKEPEDGFPPIFRVSAIPSTLLISDEGRLALETAGIRGVSFSKLKAY